MLVGGRDITPLVGAEIPKPLNGKRHLLRGQVGTGAELIVLFPVLRNPRRNEHVLVALPLEEVTLRIVLGTPVVYPPPRQD